MITFVRASRCIGAIYGLREWRSTTEKLIRSLLAPSGGSIKFFGKGHTDKDIRAKAGVLIDAPGCYPNYSVWKPPV